MTWYLWLMLFLAALLWPFSILVAVVLTAKVMRGEAIQLKMPPLPKPTYLDPARANKIVAERKREQDERSANFQA